MWQSLQNAKNNRNSKENQMRTKQNFDKNWKYIIDEVGPLPKTYAKSGIVAGISNAVDGELFEPFAGAGNMLLLCRIFFLQGMMQKVM